MDQKKIVDALSAMATVGMGLIALQPTGTINGTEVIAVNAAYLKALGASNLEAMRVLTQEIFGNEVPNGA